MSDDVHNSPGPDEPFHGNDAQVRVYRFEFRHALILSAALVVFVGLISAALSVVRFGTEMVEDGQTYSPIVVSREVGRSYRPMPKQVSEERVRSPVDSWTRYKEALREQQRTESERAISDAFATVDQNNPRQVRKFLASYKNDPIAKELGYIDAVQRGVAERRVFRSGEVVACDQCWCWREGPTNEAGATQ